MRTHIIETNSGPCPVTMPNDVTESAGFYVSFNDYDISVYGCPTTALVLGEMERFYVLCGDHRAQYASLASQGFEACLTYFQDNQSAAHKYSDKVPSAS